MRSVTVSRQNVRSFVIYRFDDDRRRPWFDSTVVANTEVRDPGLAEGAMVPVKYLKNSPDRSLLDLATLDEVDGSDELLARMPPGCREVRDIDLWSEELVVPKWTVERRVSSTGKFLKNIAFALVWFGFVGITALWAEVTLVRVVLGVFGLVGALPVLSTPIQILALFNPRPRVTVDAFVLPGLPTTVQWQMIGMDWRLRKLRIELVRTFDRLPPGDRETRIRAPLDDPRGLQKALEEGQVTVGKTSDSRG